MVLEYLVGQEYKVIRTTSSLDVHKFDQNKKIKHEYCNLEIEPSDLQPNRKNVGNRLEYLLLYQGGYVIEKSDSRNRKLDDILK